MMYENIVNPLSEVNGFSMLFLLRLLEKLIESMVMEFG